MIFLIILLVYIAGYIVSYYNMKFIHIYIMKEEWTWEEVSFNLRVSLLSWIWVICAYVLAATYVILEIEDRTDKPTKWL